MVRADWPTTDECTSGYPYRCLFQNGNYILAAITRPGGRDPIPEAKRPPELPGGLKSSVKVVYIRMLMGKEKRYRFSAVSTSKRSP